MEKIAIISDIHGNITALDTVIEDINKRGIKRIFCLGDCILKCANPDLVIDVLKQNCEIILKGNCDDVISKPDVAPGRFWSRDKIGEERATFLYNLPIFHEFYMSGHFIRLFHASPFSLYHMYNPMYNNTKDSNYYDMEIEDPELLFENTQFLGKTCNDKTPDIVGYGHIHSPSIYRFKNKTLFNPGSIGVPIEMLNNNEKDCDNKFSTLSSYIILEGKYNSKELSSLSLNLVRLPYDINKEIEYLNNSNMPNKHIIIKSLKTAISN